MIAQIFKTNRSVFGPTISITPGVKEWHESRWLYFLCISLLQRCGPRWSFMDNFLQTFCITIGTACNHAPDSLQDTARRLWNSVSVIENTLRASRVFWWQMAALIRACFLVPMGPINKLELHPYATINLDCCILSQQVWQLEAKKGEGTSTLKIVDTSQTSSDLAWDSMVINQ